MINIVTGEAHKICAVCTGGATKMVKLPYLEEVYQCPVCSGFECRTPDVQNDEAEEEEEEQYSGPRVL